MNGVATLSTTWASAGALTVIAGAVRGPVFWVMVPVPGLRVRLFVIMLPSKMRPFPLMLTAPVAPAFPILPMVAVRPAVMVTLLPP